MALANYTLPFGGLGGQSWSATISPIQQHATAVNNLLYGPAGHQETDLEPDGTNDEYYKNEPYATPSHRVTQQNYRRNNNEYLPPVPVQYNTQSTRSQTRSQYQTQTTRTYGEGSYSNVPQRTAQAPNTQYFNNYNNQRVTYAQTPTATPQPNTRSGSGGAPKESSTPTVTPIQGPIFLKNGTVPVVPLFSYPTLNNGTFVQIPIWWTALSVALGLEIRGEVIQGTPCIKRHNQLFCPTAGNSYPVERIEQFIDENKALMRRMYGDFEMVTQYGPPLQSNKRKRDTNYVNNSTMAPGVPDMIGPPDNIINTDQSGSGASYFEEYRKKRQTNPNEFNRANQRTTNGPTKPTIALNPSMEPHSGRIDACESKIEIVTPYWASNSAGKIRAIVNTQHFEQAIHQEVCTKLQTSRCGGECGCEQKYKWHRLLAYDPDNDCKGIFMDWFLFPSCCILFFIESN
ncbi:Protein spaetzle 3, partial [Pseudolycoriella hygida]